MVPHAEQNEASLALNGLRTAKLSPRSWARTATLANIVGHFSTGIPNYRFLSSRSLREAFVRPSTRSSPAMRASIGPFVHGLVGTPMEWCLARTSN